MKTRLLPGLSCSMTLLILTSFLPPEVCTPSGGVDPNANCVKVITGCVCQGTAVITVTPIQGCGGCNYVIAGEISCTDAHGVGTNTPINCSGTISCGQRAACGETCYCTGASFTPFVAGCGFCP